MVIVPLSTNICQCCIEYYMAIIDAKIQCVQGVCAQHIGPHKTDNMHQLLIVSYPVPFFY